MVKKKLGKSFEFQARMLKWLLENNGYPPRRPHSIYPHRLRTKVGTLQLGFDDDRTIYACFADPEFAETLLGGESQFNINSGKWNFHFPIEWPDDQCYDEWVRRIAKVLPDPKPAAAFQHVLTLTDNFGRVLAVTTVSDSFGIPGLNGAEETATHYNQQLKLVELDGLEEPKELPAVLAWIKNANSDEDEEDSDDDEEAEGTTDGAG